MMAGADEPATLSGLCQPMAIAMVSGLKTSIRVWSKSDARQTHQEDCGVVDGGRNPDGVDEVVDGGARRREMGESGGGKDGGGGGSLNGAPRTDAHPAKGETRDSRKKGVGSLSWGWLQGCPEAHGPRWKDGGGQVKPLARRRPRWLVVGKPLPVLVGCSGSRLSWGGARVNGQPASQQWVGKNRRRVCWSALGNRQVVPLGGRHECRIRGRYPDSSNIEVLRRVTSGLCMENCWYMSSPVQVVGRYYKPGDSKQGRQDILR